MQFIRGAAGLKVKEVRAGALRAAPGCASVPCGRPGPYTCCPAPQVPTYVSKYANEHWQPAIVQRRLTTWMNNYKKQVRAYVQRSGRGWRVC